MRFLPLTSKTFKLASAVTLPIALAFVVRRSFTSTMAPSLASLRTSNVEFVGNLQGKPVAVFVGGTSGIGQGRAHIVIVGRNEAAAKDIISHFPQVPASEQGQWTYEFVKCDATLMKEVKRASSEILSRHPKINYLVMSPGYFTTSGRDESEEGIDKKLAVHYYARWKFTEELLPALKAAKAQGEDARVLTVLAAGKGGKIDVNDLGLKTGFSLRAAAEQSVTYNDYLVESFAERNPDITFAHAYPGIVRTNILSSSRTPWLRVLNPLMTVLGPLLTVTIEECGTYLWHGLLANAKEPGAYRIDNNGDVIREVQYSGDKEVAEKLWQHTVEATRV
ncbi:hypothetical protein FA13DRAFT_1742246 [Coprinellus micaceus]|uniref:NAD(P)-binding protein n=1 Tax=Coprinellus micaceus TaxID=71717 RepID=A0A4Y7SH59_COPMI|nr:hypothetical protein FA13DRAFT_1742246 [Coprinellus micaceus]